MLIVDAQADLRRAYTDGGPGVLISGLVWLAAWFAESRGGIPTGFAVLFFGGMLIYPLALLANRALLRRAGEQKGNPGGPLVMESTIAMIAGLFGAFLFLDHAPELVMPLAAIMVGTHYFAFKTAYGDKAFWLLGAVITLLGFAAIYHFLPLPGSVTLQVAVVEILFGIGLTLRGTRG
ncbi:hypothetical protein [Erythrobacter sp.]|uniref:DUF7010 family protein n=1 Tax=Erythrobacter sp. TaxID=1042 RepID=UPI001B13A890|nr:hypothetical protein [Erythrobacter sp.]MBO6526230.1 hypothetical protein [Erythrobacter sp.]MBO6530483.1 hypothetical protein [Erythrobacter sp.]